MRNDYANVDPKALDKMNESIQILIEQLEKTKIQMTEACETSYQSGNRDVQFEKIRSCIAESEDDIHNLKSFMLRYTTYLKKQAEVIKRYLGNNGPK